MQVPKWLWPSVIGAIVGAVLCTVLFLSIPDSGPTPGPGPTPTPTPIDPVVPIKEPGFRVLVVYESADGVPASVNGGAVRDYLTAKCAKGPDGKTADFKVWDQDIDLTNASRYFAEAMLRPRASLPWILISDGKKGFEGPLPEKSAEVLELLKKYGGEW